MKKVLLLLVTAGVAVCTILLVANRMNDHLSIDVLMEANVEALSAGEGDVDVSCEGSGSIFCPLTLMQDSRSVTYTEI